MVADFFSKPLQGSLFLYFRDIVLGHQRPQFPSLVHDGNQERVENGIRISNNAPKSETKSWAEIVRDGYTKVMTSSQLQGPKNPGHLAENPSHLGARYFDVSKKTKRQRE